MKRLLISYYWTNWQNSEYFFGNICIGNNIVVNIVSAINLPDGVYQFNYSIPGATPVTGNSGNVAITSKDSITEVAVYNVQGQLLYNQKINQLRTNVDMSQFALGTYFFKLKINDREANFKILKM
jgi:hypothetical protein